MSILLILSFFLFYVIIYLFTNCLFTRLLDRAKLEELIVIFEVKTSSLTSICLFVSVQEVIQLISGNNCLWYTLTFI